MTYLKLDVANKRCAYLIFALPTNRVEASQGTFPI
jgi:hypothetical protein